MSTWSSLHRHTAKCSTPHVCFRARCYGRAPVQRGTCAAGHGRRLPLLTARPSQRVDSPYLLPAYYSATLECTRACVCGFRQLFERRSVCVAFAAVAGRRCACTVCTTQRACRVDCSRPPSPPRTSRRPCTGLRARDGHGRREQAASCSEQLPWDRAPVCLPGAPYSRTVLAKSGADHLVSYHRWRRLAHHRLDGLSHCDPCSRIHTGCGRVHTGCDRK